MQQQSHKADLTKLRNYLRAAGPTGLRAYVEMLIAQLQLRAASTPSQVDDLLIIALRVLLERLFPERRAEPSALAEGPNPNPEG